MDCPCHERYSVCKVRIIDYPVDIAYSVTADRCINKLQDDDVCLFNYNVKCLRVSKNYSISDVSFPQENR